MALLGSWTDVVAKGTAVVTRPTPSVVTDVTFSFAHCYRAAVRHHPECGREMIALLLG